MIDNEIYDFVYKRYCENCKRAFSDRIENIAFGGDSWKLWLEDAREDMGILAHYHKNPDNYDESIFHHFTHFSRALYLLDRNNQINYLDSLLK
jgi:hypothetical protein